MPPDIPAGTVKACTTWLKTAKRFKIEVTRAAARQAHHD
jgi:hypothetical protein